ncbi:MAG: hypothetical protein ABIX12_02810 [Rubrivivax sp.]
MVDAHHALGDLGRAWELAGTAVADALTQDEPSVHIIAATCVMPPLSIVGEAQLARQLLAAISDEALRQLPGPASEMWVALAQMELRLQRPAEAACALERLDGAGGPSDERVRVRLAHTRCGLALALGNAEAALAALPADDASGMNVELRTRGVAWRIEAEAMQGRVRAATMARARAMLAAPSEHAQATLELHAALARAARRGAPGVPAGAVDRHAVQVQTLAQTLSAHLAQRAAFEAAWH